MSLLHHYNDESDNSSYEELKRKYIAKVENDPMATLNEIRNVHLNGDNLTAKEFCQWYGLRIKE